MNAETTKIVIGFLQKHLDSIDVSIKELQSKLNDWDKKIELYQAKNTESIKVMERQNVHHRQILREYGKRLEEVRVNIEEIKKSIELTKLQVTTVVKVAQFLSSLPVKIAGIASAIMTIAGFAAWLMGKF